MDNQNVSQKLISNHLLSGEMKPGSEIGLKIDHVLQQDATGTLIMLELEAFQLEKAKAEVAVQYVDHNLLQTDYKNMDDHIDIIEHHPPVLGAPGLAITEKPLLLQRADHFIGQGLQVGRATA